MEGEGAAALSVTVPCPLAPAVTVAALSVTDDSAVVGKVGDVVEPPHCIEATRPLTAARSVIKERECVLTCFMPDEVSTSVPRARLNSPEQKQLGRSPAGSAA